MVGALNLKDVRKQFAAPDGQKTEVLRSVSLDIAPGSFISLIGGLLRDWINQITAIFCLTVKE